MDWWAHNGAGVQSIATVVLVVVTAYYAWQSRSTVREMRKTAKAHTEEWDRQRDDLAEERRRAAVAARKALLANAVFEAKANLDLMGEIHTHHAWLPVPIDALERLGEAISQPTISSEAVARLRTSARRYNAAAMYSNEKVGYGSGAMDNFLTELAQAVERDLREATSELEKLRAAL